MFYTFLILFSFTEFYFFRLLNRIIFQKELFSGDIIFAIFCLVLSFFILLGTLHIKHKNNEILKRIGKWIIIFGIIYFLAFCISLNIRYIIAGFEFGIIIVIFGYFIYYYQTVPEGEPDIEIDESEIEDEYSGEYYNLDDLKSNVIEIPFEDLEENYLNASEDNINNSNFDLFIEDDMLANILTSINEILLIEEILSDLDLYEKLENARKLILQIYNANSDYKFDHINNINIIFQKYLEYFNEDHKHLKIVEENLENINKSLENIYYNTRGAAVFKLEKLANDIVNEINKNNN